MKNKRVKDIMVPLEKYPSVTDTTTLHQAIQEMGKAQILKRQVTSLPRTALVFDKDHHELLGILRRRDIMHGLEPKFLASGVPDYQKKLFNVEIDPNLSELSYEKTISGIRERANRTVGQYMQPIKGTINSSDHIMKAIYEMVTMNVSLLPVIDEGNVVGVVRSLDVLYELALIISCEE